MLLEYIKAKFPKLRELVTATRSWVKSKSPVVGYIVVSFAILCLVLISVTVLYQASVIYVFTPNNPQNAQYLRGFYPSETNQAFEYQWAKPTWQIILPQVGQRPYNIELLTTVPTPATVQVFSVNGKEIYNFLPKETLTSFKFSVPAEAVSDGDLRLTFRTAQFNQNQVGDPRNLGLIVSQIKVSSQAGGLVLPPLSVVLLVLGLTLSLYWAGYFGLSLLVGHWRWVLRPIIATVAGWGWACLVIYNARPSVISTILPVTFFFLVIAGLLWLPLIVANLWKMIIRPQLEPKTNSLSNQPHPARWVYWTLAAILIFAAILRLTNINALPIFLDEGMHIRAGLAAQTGKLDQTGLFALAYSGRALQGWLLAALFNLIDPDNLLELARILSAICGLVTVLVCFKLGEKLFSAKAGLGAAGLWAIAPFTVWHERMALVDPLMTSCAALTIYFSLRLIEIETKNRWVILGYTTLLGLSMTLGVLTKATALLTILAPILAILILSSPGQWSKVIPRLGPIYAVFWITTIPIINLLKGQWLGEYQGGQYTSEPTPGVLLDNLAKVGEWVYAYFTLPILMLIAVGLILAFRHTWRISLWLFLLILFPLLALTLVAGSSFFPRYLLFLLVPLVVLAAGGLDQAMNWLIKWEKASWGLALLTFVCLPALWFNYQTIFSPAESALPIIDREGYIEGWAAGSGLGKSAII